MAYKNREFDYHLTPVGWTTHEIASSYTIETWRLSIYQEFAWSKAQRAWRRIWHNMAWSETERERFRQTFDLPTPADDQTPTEQILQPDAERKRA